MTQYTYTRYSCTNTHTLVAFIEASPVVGQRRSPRLQQSESQRADYGVDFLLQEEILQDAVRG
jgi:hypothetical protein